MRLLDSKSVITQNLSASSSTSAAPAHCVPESVLSSSLHPHQPSPFSHSSPILLALPFRALSLSVHERANGAFRFFVNIREDHSVVPIKYSANFFNALLFYLHDVKYRVGIFRMQGLNAGKIIRFIQYSTEFI